MLHNMLRAAAGRDRIPTDGLIAHYTMDNISGSTLVDEQGAYDGTIAGATQTTGVIGQALSFDGNDYITAASIPENSTTTVCFWGKFDNFSVAVIFEKNQTDFWSIQKNNNFGNYVKISKIGTGDVLRTTETLNTGVFYHFIIEITQNAIGKIFINNIQDSGADGGSRPLTGSSQQTLIGSRSGTAGVSGLLDDVFIYNRALTRSEREIIYGRGA